MSFKVKGFQNINPKTIIQLIGLQERLFVHKVTEQNTLFYCFLKWCAYNKAEVCIL